MPLIDHSRAVAAFDALVDARHFVFMFVGFLIVCQLATFVYYLRFHPLSKFPGPPLMAVVYFPFLYRNYIKGTWARDTLELHKKYGPAVRVGPNHLALDGSIAWPEVFAHRSGGKAEFVKHPDFFTNGAESIIAANRSVHRRQRRQLGHAFSDSALREQEPIIKAYIDLLLERLGERALTGTSVNIVDWFNFTTFDIIGDLTFADSFHSLENNGYHPWVRGIFQGIQGGAMTRFLKVYVPLPLVKISTFFSPTMKKDQENRLFAKEKALARMSDGAEPKDGRRDFMTYMLKKNRDGEHGMTESEIIGNSPLLIVAGSETTATSLSGLWFNLARNPSVYKILADEIRSSFTSEDDMDIRSTSSLPYLHACLEENLRVYPPVPETPPRVSPGDIINGNYVPAGTSLSVYQWATFRNPAHFTDPESFRPERWLPETHPLYDAQFKNDNKAVFKPFSYGARDCLGKNLAYAELRLITSRMLYRFDYELDGKHDSWQTDQKSFIIWSKGPLKIKLHQRASVS